MGAFDYRTMGTAPLGRGELRLPRLTPAEQWAAGRLPRRFLQLLIGVILYGLGLALMLTSAQGNAPWDVLHQGIAGLVPLSLGTILVIASLAILLLWIPLREQPGIGTVVNAILVGVFVDVFMPILDRPDTHFGQLVMVAAGIWIVGLATAVYLGAQLGSGPRDGLMTGLHRVTGLSLRLVRTGLEVAVVIVGFLLGGTLGLGTIAFALLIGPITQHYLPMVLVELPLNSSSRSAPKHRERPSLQQR